MKLHRTPTLVLTALAAIAITLTAASPLATGPSPDEGELYDQMLAMDDGMTFLRKSLRDPESNAESLLQIVAMQRAALACKLLTPPTTESQPEDARSAYLLKFRKQLIGVAHELLHLETAVLDGDNEKAREIYKKLHELEEAGHDEFAEE